MICHEYRIKCTGRSDKFNLVPIGDIHYGTKNCDLNKLKDTVDWIRKSPNTYWLGMGDYCEFVNPSDPRIDFANIKTSLLEHLSNLHNKEQKDIAEILKPIAPRCIGLLHGNHEETIRTKYHSNPTEFLATTLNTINLSYTAMIRIVFERLTSRKSVIVFACHGNGSSRSEAGSINTIVGKSKDFQADVYLMGHVHQKIVKDRDIMVMNNSGMPVMFEKKQVFGITGTFYKTYGDTTSSYAEKGGYSPTPTGCIKILIEPFVKKNLGGKFQTDLPAHIHISA